MDNKVLKLKLHPEMHRAFKEWAFHRSTTMQSELESHVKDLVKGEIKVPSMERKQAVVASGVVVKGIERGLGGDPVKSPVASMEIHDARMAKCRHCYDVFPVADMVTDKKTGWLFCSDCVDNMKGGQV